VRIHFTREHARQFEPAHAFFELRGVVDDLGESGFVDFSLDNRKKLRGVRQAAAKLVEFGDRRLEPRAFSPQCLRLRRRLPDRGIRELVIQLFEALALRIVLKGTPSALSGAQ
jgi:hypothetical protein